MSDTDPNTVFTPPGTGAAAPAGAPARIPDYDLILHIGQGSFGNVWLARSKATGRYRAVKVVYAARLPDAQAYDIEFAGLKRFEEVSREHLGFVDILHISRHDEEGYFYYVMELADDVKTGPQIIEECYECRTLAAVLAAEGRLPAAECVRVAMALTDAVAALHQHGLVHRDLKPANIVFVRGSPKLADIGLVTEATACSHTAVMGTLPYMDEQIHGTPAGDLYSLGKILYVMATGRPAKDWPAWPEDVARFDDLEDFRDLDRIFRRACHVDRARRYASASELREDLAPLQVNASLRRLQRMGRLLAGIRRHAGIGVVLISLLVLAGLLWARNQRQVADLHHRRVGSFIAYGTRAIDEQNYLGALPWFAQALRLDAGNPERAETHRLRLASVLQSVPELVQVWFNDRRMSHAAFAGREDQVLARGSDRRWGILDVATGNRLSVPFGTGAAMEAASISLSAGLALTSGLSLGSDEPTNVVRIWSLAEPGRELPSFVYGTRLSDAVISPDGQLGAAAAGTNAVLWNLASGRTEAILWSHTKDLLHLEFSHDGKRLATTGEDGLVVVWDVVGKCPWLRLTLHTSWVYDASFSYDDRFLATCSFDRSVRLWDAATGSEVAEPIWNDDGVFSAEFSTDGERLVTACLDFSVRLWEWDKAKRRLRLVQRLPHEAKPIYAAFSPEGRHIITATYEGTVRVWRLQLHAWSRESPAKASSQDGLHLVEAVRGQLQVTDVRDNSVARSVPSPGLTCLTALLSDQAEKLLVVSAPDPATGTNRAQATLWDVRGGQPGTGVVSLPLPLPRLVLSPAGDRLAVLDANRFTAWDTEGGGLLYATNQAVRCAAFDPSGLRIALAWTNLAGSEVIIHHFQTGSQQPPGSLQHILPVDSIAWDHRGHRIVTACWDNSFASEAGRVWDTTTGLRTGPPLNHRDGVRFAAFSPDDRMIVTCGEDFAAILWEAESGLEKVPPLVHRHQVVQAAFSKDGRWLATACRDGTARIWDTETGEAITPPLPDAMELSSVQFLDGTRYLYTRNTNDQVRLWDLASDTRPIEQLVAISELLSSQQSGPGETMQAASNEALRNSWNRLHPAAQNALRGP